MASYICPSCGARYNGKKCRDCLYEHFTEEIAHGAHVHEGEPLVIDAPVRRPVKRKDPFGCEKKTRKRHPMAGFIVLLVLINSLLPVLRNWGLDLEAREESHAAAAPEAAPWMSEDVLLLWEQEDIRILADWAGRDQGTGDFTVYIENDRDETVYLSSWTVVVNGYDMQSSGIFCDAYPKSTTRSNFRFDETELRDAAIKEIRELTFYMEVYNADFASLFVTDVITLTDDSVKDTGRGYVGGVEVYAQDGIRVSYLGYEGPGAVSEGDLLFHLENDTDRTLQFYTNRTSDPEGLLELFLYRQLPPHTKAVARMELSGMYDLGLESLDQISPLAISLDIYDVYDPDFQILTEPVSLPLQ